MAGEVFDRILSSARVRLPGALDSMIKQELFGVIEDMTSDTGVWREVFDVSVAAGDTGFMIAPPAGSSAVRLLELSSDSGQPIAAEMGTIGNVTFASPAPDAMQLKAVVSLKPADPVVSGTDLPDVPEWIVQRYWRVVLDGVLGAMMSQPAKPYSSEKMAIYHTRRFRNGLASIRADVVWGNVQGGQRWRFPNFA